MSAEKPEEILIVDDEELILDLLPQFIEKGFGNKFAVIGRENVPDALDILKNPENNIKLIITDYNMPKQSGDVLVKYVQDNKLGIPVIVQTGGNSESSLRAKHGFFDESVDIYLKPISFTQFIQAVKKALARGETKPAAKLSEAAAQVTTGQIGQQGATAQLTTAQQKETGPSEISGKAIKSEATRSAPAV
jgi:DNA-binding NtrC family response regulator